MPLTSSRSATTATAWLSPATSPAGAGSVHVAARAFMGTAVTASDPSGQSFTDTAISNLIAKQHAANPSYLDMPVHYVKGTADYLIPSTEETALASDMEHHRYERGVLVEVEQLPTPEPDPEPDPIAEMQATIDALLDALGGSDG